MSMDEQYVQMRRFKDSLERFNGALGASVSELEKCHENVHPHWQDEMRRTYDSHWEPLREHMHQYIQKEGPAYVAFLVSKIAALGRYLHG